MNLFENLSKLNENEESITLMRTDIDHRIEYIEDMLETVEQLNEVSTSTLKFIDLITSQMYDLATRLEDKLQ